jgi:serine/threonine protein kinase
MGSVYKAEQLLMDRIVAIKILPQQHAKDDRTLKRFEAEAKISCQVNHPNAVLLHDFGVDDGMPYLVMEFIEGKTLKQLLEGSDPLPPARIYRIMQQVCAALGEAHASGIVHRDVKPSNIMLRASRGDEDLVKVLDFGVAKVMKHAATVATDLTMAGAIVGTPKYMSPEQGMSKELDVRSDIYSLGCVLYEMVTTLPPFDATSSIEQIVLHVNSPPIPPSQRCADRPVSPKLEEVILKCLEKDPAKRYQNAADLSRDLKKALSGLSGSSDTVEVPTDIKPATGSRRFAPYVLGAVLVAAPLIYMLTQDEGRIRRMTPPPGEQPTEPVKVEQPPAGPTPEELEAERQIQELEFQAAKKQEQERIALENERKRVEAEAAAKLEEMKAEIARQAEAARKAEEEKQAILKRSEEEKQAALLLAEKEKQAMLREAEAAKEKARLETEAYKRDVAAREAEQRRQVERDKEATKRAERERQRREKSRSVTTTPTIEQTPKTLVIPPTTAKPATQTPSAVEPSESKPKRKRCGPNWCL